MIQVRVNGDPRFVPSGVTLRELLGLIHVAEDAALAIERNRRVVPRPEWSAVALEEGDVLEVVTLVGGG